MRTVILLALMLLAFAPITAGYAQQQILVRILEPVGFIAPGQLEQVVVEVSNPAGSGVDIVRIGGFGSSGRSETLIGTPRPRLINVQEWRAPPETRCRQEECIVAGRFPVRPGESIQYRLTTLFAPSTAPIGTELGAEKIHVSIQLNDGRQAIRYYAQNDVIRIVAADGHGDFALFEGLNLQSTAAGTLNANLSTRFDYVDTIEAGGAFDLYATFENNGDFSVYLLGLGVGFSGLQFHVREGEHRDSFRYVACSTDCQQNPSGSFSAGSIQLEPGDSVTQLLGTFFYENESYFEGQLLLDELHLLVQDESERTDTVVLEAPPVTVNVVNRSSTVPSAAGTLPLPLEQYDLLADNDQLLIYDPNTGLEWLRMEAGAGYTLEQMLSETRPGGRFGGFSLATAAQVERLALNHINSTGTRLGAYALYATLGPSSTDQIESWQSLLQLFGPMPTVNSVWAVIGLVSDQPERVSPGSELYTAIEIQAPEPAQDGARPILFTGGNGMSKKLTREENPAYSYMGYWMVRE